MIADIRVVLIGLAFAELFPALHHASLAARRHFARKSGLECQVTTTQLQLVRLQALALLSVALVAAIRLALGQDLIQPGVLAPFLFWMVFACGVYWRYPDAAPLAVAAPSWQFGLMRYLRVFWAVFAGVFAACLAVLGVLAA